MASLATTNYANYAITLGGATLFQLKCDASPIENHVTKTLLSIKYKYQGEGFRSSKVNLGEGFRASNAVVAHLEEMVTQLYGDGEGPMMIWKGVMVRALRKNIPLRPAYAPKTPYETKEKKQAMLKALGTPPTHAQKVDLGILKNICAEQTTPDEDLIDISGTVLSSHADAGGGLQEIIKIVRDTLIIINPVLEDLEISTKEGDNHFHIFNSQRRQRVAINNIQTKIVLTFGTPPAPTQVSDRALAWTVAREQGERTAMTSLDDVYAHGEGVEQSTESGSGARNWRSNSTTTNNSGKYVPPARRTTSETKTADTSASWRSKGHGSSTKYMPPARRTTSETETADTSASWRSKGHGSSTKYVPPARRPSETKTADTSASWKTVKNKKNKKGKKDKKGKNGWGGRKTRRKRRYSKRKTRRKTRRKTKRKTRRKTIRKKRKTRKR